MTFLDKARQAAEQATSQAKVMAEKAATEARHAAEQARDVAGEQAQHAAAAAQRAQATLNDPATADRARAAVGRARKGLATAIERIDPDILADVVIRATALQERTNRSVRAKGSAYRISEVSIGASIPPSVTFAIQRIDDESDLPAGGEIPAAELAAGLDAPPGGAIQGLDGTMLSEDGVESNA